jgi:hypothetical protein
MSTPKTPMMLLSSSKIGSDAIRIMGCLKYICPEARHGVYLYIIRRFVCQRCSENRSI